jgi:hypothetical protein
MVFGVDGEEQKAEGGIRMQSIADGDVKSVEQRRSPPTTLHSHVSPVHKTAE